MQSIKNKITYIFFAVLIFFVFNLCNYSFAFLIPKNYISESNDQKVYDASLKETLTSINDYIENNIKKKPRYFFSNLKIGDIVNFGRYYIGTEEDKEKILPIEWKVLDVKSDKALLISRYILDNMRVNERWEPTSWKTCTLRKWLNEDFYIFAFNHIERKEILLTENINCQNEKFIGGNIENTFDKIFLLSTEEFEKYFDKEKRSEIMTKGTHYALKNELWISKSVGTFGYSVWWLRTPGKNTSYESLVEAAGFIGYRGDGVYTLGNGIRPCMWVRIKE